MSENKAYLNGVEIGTVEDFNVFVKGVNKMSEEIIKQDINTKPTQKELFLRFVQLYSELALLTEDVKALSEEVKEHYADLDIPNMKKVAKAKAESKLGDSVDKVNEFLQAVEEYTH